MKPYRYGISLRVFHPTIDPDKISRELGLKPFRCWKAGEPRTTPIGTPLKGNWAESYWCSKQLIRGALPRGQTLPAAISKLLDRLEPYKTFFHRIRVGGGRVELDVGWYFPVRGGDVFDYALQARLAKLKIDLSLDIYPPDQPQNSF